MTNVRSLLNGQLKQREDVLCLTINVSFQLNGLSRRKVEGLFRTTSETWKFVKSPLNEQ
jgi:hypothetical protein